MLPRCARAGTGRRGCRCSDTLASKFHAMATGGNTGQLKVDKKTWALGVCVRQQPSSGRSTRMDRAAGAVPQPVLVCNCSPLREGRVLGLGALVAAAVEPVAQVLEGEDERQRRAEDGRGQPLMRRQQRARRVEHVVVWLGLGLGLANPNPNPNPNPGTLTLTP